MILPNVPPNFRLTAPLIKTQTSDGYIEMDTNKTCIGRIYHLDPASKRLKRFYDNKSQNQFDCEIIDVWDEDLQIKTFLPVELFDI